jgi:hypothetical protein
MERERERGRGRERSVLERLIPYDRLTGSGLALRGACGACGACGALPARGLSGQTVGAHWPIPHESGVFHDEREREQSGSESSPIR